MRSYVGEELRRLVAARAEHICEYCLIHEDDTFLGCEVDHIISVKHGGPTVADNQLRTTSHMPVPSAIVRRGATSDLSCGEPVSSSGFLIRAQTGGVSISD
jgi:hypothetical protein